MQSGEQNSERQARKRKGGLKQKESSSSSAAILVCAFIILILFTIISITLHFGVSETEAEGTEKDFPFVFSKIKSLEAKYVDPYIAEGIKEMKDIESIYVDPYIKESLEGIKVLEEKYVQPYLEEGVKELNYLESNFQVPESVKKIESQFESYLQRLGEGIGVSGQISGTFSGTNSSASIVTTEFDAAISQSTGQSPLSNVETIPAHQLSCPNAELVTFWKVLISQLHITQEKLLLALYHTDYAESST